MAGADARQLTAEGKRITVALKAHFKGTYPPRIQQALWKKGPKTPTGYVDLLIRAEQKMESAPDVRDDSDDERPLRELPLLPEDEEPDIRNMDQEQLRDYLFPDEDLEDDD